MQDVPVPPQPVKSKYPRAVPFIIGNEAAERFSFYGMRSILVTFLVAQFYNPTHDKALTTVAEAHANESTHFFVTLAYALPFVGGLVADWFTGKYKIILYISMVYCVGHLFLAMFDNSLTGFSAGLILVAIGAGGIKSCVSANVGDQFDATNQDLLSKVYGWFYFAINAGSVFSTILIPWVYEQYGAKWAFGIPGVLMGIATIIFFSGRKMYVRVPPAGELFKTNPFSFKGRIRRTEYMVSIIISSLLFAVAHYLINHFGPLRENTSATAFFATSILPYGFIIWFHLSQSARRCHDIGKSGWYQLIPFYDLWLLFASGNEESNVYGNVPPPSGVNKNNFVFITVYSLTHLGKKSEKDGSWLDVAKKHYNPERVDGIKAVYRVIAVFFFAFAFWAVWDQNLSEWVLQAAKMNRTINLGFYQFTMLAGQVQTFNPVFLLLFIPIFNYWIYPYFDRIGLKATPLRRIGAGLVLTALSFVIIALIQANIDHGGTPSIWWQIFAYVILSAAEVLVSITGLEYAYTHAPKSMKSTMTAIWLLVVSLGNLFTGMINNNISNKGFLAPYLIGANYYWFFIGVVSVFTVAFMIVSPRLKEHNYITDPYIDNQVIADTNNL